MSGTWIGGLGELRVTFSGPQVCSGRTEMSEGKDVEREGRSDFLWPARVSGVARPQQYTKKNKINGVSSLAKLVSSHQSGSKFSMSVASEGLACTGLAWCTKGEK